MNYYKNKNIIGNLWLRDYNNNVRPANQLLSAIYIKYKDVYPNMYYDLENNNIINFDTFYDSIYIKTSSGFFFEKIAIEDNIIYPYSEFDFYFKNGINDIDYWFDERSKKVYFCGFDKLSGSNVSKLIFSIYFKEFSITDAYVKTLLNKTVTLSLSSQTNLSNSNGITEDPKLTFNPASNTYNISFLIRNDINQAGLISINLKNINYLEIDRIDATIPFGNLDSYNSSITDTLSSLIIK